MAANNAREEILIATTSAAQPQNARMAPARAGARRAARAHRGVRHLQPRRYRHRRRHDRVPARAAAEVGLPEVPHPHDGRAERPAVRSMHEAVTRRFPALCGRRPGLARCRICCSSTAAPSTRRSHRRCSTAGLQVPVFGMVRTTATARARSSRPAGMRSALPPTPRCLPSLAPFQEETHRFSIDYQRRLRREASRPSSIRSPAWAAQRAAQGLPQRQGHPRGFV